MTRQLALPEPAPCSVGDRVGFDRSVFNFYPGHGTVESIDQDRRIAAIRVSDRTVESVPWSWVERWMVRHGRL